jgi:N-acetylglucosamine-6-sulfatase
VHRPGLIALGLACFVGVAVANGKGPATQARPNIVVIETDDQTQTSLAFMPKTRALLAAQGVTFDNSFVSYSLCCPSRATFLTGQYAHNHGVLGNSPPVGGYDVFRTKHATSNLAVWLQRSGYYTALIGKFLNGYGRRGLDIGVPPGWSEWHAGVDLSYLGGTMSDNGKLDQLPSTEAGYQTDVWSRLAQDLIQRRAPSTQPFFLWLTPHVPHTGGPSDPDDPQPMGNGRRARARGAGTTRPPARYRNRFANQPLPMPASFNEADVSDKPVGIRKLPQLTDQQVAGIREAYQQALEADLGVDDLVGAVVERLKTAGELDDTLIVFTSDNGFFYGEHRVAKGKVRLYEPSIRVPLIVRGPSVPKNLHLKQMPRTSTSLRRSSTRPARRPV